jgi:hypothetical protein
LNVINFGLHIADGGIPFLLESDGGHCLWNDKLASPFTTTLRNCPHAIAKVPPEPGEISEGLELLAPRVNGGAFFVPNLSVEHQRAAELLTCATRSISFPAWAVDWKALVAELTLTNIQPMFVTGLEVRHFQKLQKLLTLPRTRTLIVQGTHRLAGLHQVELPDVKPDESWRRLGAHLVRTSC